MQTRPRPWWVLLPLVLALPIGAQERNASVVAATVNGQPIPEQAIQRGLKRVPPDKQAQARKEILDYLIANTLIDQYLLQAGVEVGRPEAEGRLQQVKDEIKKSGKEPAKVLQELSLTEDELRTQIMAELRWEKFCTKQATDAVLRDHFTKNLAVFDGSMVRARHILVESSQADTQAEQKARTLKKQLDDQVVRGSTSLAGIADAAAREQARLRLIEDAFIALARKESSCPSKDEGGDLGWFPRSGSMVEAFARVAFAMKPFELSDVVATQFGYHLILVTDRRAGKETKFEDVKEVVKEVYCDLLRESMTTQLKPRAQIQITPAKN